MVRTILLFFFLCFNGDVRASLPDFANVVEKASEAVVKILVEYEPEDIKVEEQLQELPEYLQKFFDRRPSPGSPRSRGGMGSGFVSSKDGFVVTNHHVVKNARRVVVRLSDRREFDAEIVGSDPRSDLTLLKIDAENLVSLKIAEEEVKVGQWVLAIGSPFGLDFSVTAGIVSALGRSLPTDNGDNYVPFIQTDVAINPGNSGGPLFNLNGEVIGVNSQIFTRSGGSIGLSFAIPAQVLSNVVAQIEETGIVVRGWLGVSIQEVDRNLADSFKLDRPMGALISQVGSGSPAETAGLKSGDIIIGFNGVPIENSPDLPHVVGLIRPGSIVNAKVIRDGFELTVAVEVGGLGADEVARVETQRSATGSTNLFGMSLKEADRKALMQFGLTGGVLVDQVSAGSPAALAGVQPGDIVTRLGPVPVTNLESLVLDEELIEPGTSVPIRLVRGGNPLFIGIRIPK